ncbi:hypothetical protein HK097_001574 [Rhizophlyctis rosea]|uniref:CRAL-TRIO domain-containing protein n=1 Tax=Rhizophlyctis rosea TaxID=64517 RepID=A0AAD5WYV8_9FUNG|nr:hypothetical protein HK097_001574 [Rhizophlyctis rosea]
MPSVAELPTPSTWIVPKSMKVPVRTKGTDADYATFTAELERRFQDLEVSKLSEWWRVMFFDQHRGDVESALKAIERTLKWRQSYGWYNLPNEDFSAELSAKKLYFHGLDKAGNPVLVWRFSRHISSNGDPAAIDRIVRFVVWTMAKAIEEGTITRQATFMMDRIGSTGENNEGIALIRTLINTIQVNMPEVVHKMVIFPTNMLIHSMWRLAKPFLDSRMVDKVVMCSEKEVTNTLLTIIDSNELAQRYGGTSVDPNDA